MLQSVLDMIPTSWVTQLTSCFSHSCVDYFEYRHSNDYNKRNKIYTTCSNLTCTTESSSFYSCDCCNIGHPPMVHHSRCIDETCPFDEELSIDKYNTVFVTRPKPNARIFTTQEIDERQPAGDNKLDQRHDASPPRIPSEIAVSPESKPASHFVFATDYIPAIISIQRNAPEDDEVSVLLMEDWFHKERPLTPHPSFEDDDKPTEAVKLHLCVKSLKLEVQDCPSDEGNFPPCLHQLQYKPTNQFR